MLRLHVLKINPLINLFDIIVLSKNILVGTMHMDDNYVTKIIIVYVLVKNITKSMNV